MAADPFPEPRLLLNASAVLGGRSTKEGGLELLAVLPLFHPGAAHRTIPPAKLISAGMATTVTGSSMTAGLEIAARRSRSRVVERDALDRIRQPSVVADLAHGSDLTGTGVQGRVGFGGLHLLQASALRGAKGGAAAALSVLTFQAEGQLEQPVAGGLSLAATVLWRRPRPPAIEMRSAHQAQVELALGARAIGLGGGGDTPLRTAGAPALARVLEAHSLRASWRLNLPVVFLGAVAPAHRGASSRW